MTPQEIKAGLVLKGISMGEIARRADAWPSEVTRCINGEGLYIRIRGVIARAINKPVGTVFARHHPKPVRTSNRRAA